ncbi:hypothetical protein [Hymenobacter sp. CRA2]|uniref:hypothetical protein n=1 Tax=Hymenobacter sp. CRA2 TaxID=1955620 RepID=UPI00098E9816|nr:hypothetical protein [Hymenobacter sp. CRA2]OON68124.1 hypothetical protein B0919_15865 [Hymenobacter sp. CRA2]
MLHTAAFTTWMLNQGYPPKTPRAYLRDIERAVARTGVALEPISVANTNQLLHRIDNESLARTRKQISNDKSAVNCYHEFRTGLALPGYKRRGAQLAAAV